MNIHNLLAGIQILLPHYGLDSTGYVFDVELEEFRMYPTPHSRPDSDVQKMIDLRWHQEHDERDYGEDFAVKDYRPDKAWIAYV